MREKGNQRQKLTASKTRMRTRTSSSSDDEDSDVEKNFALLTGKHQQGWSEEEEQYHRGDEDEVLSEQQDGDEDEEESEDDEGESDDGAQEKEEEGSDDGEEEGEGDKEENDDSDVSEEEDEDQEDGAGGSELHTKEDVKKELSNMSFEDIMKLQTKVGTKVYNAVAYDINRRQEISKKRRLNKNRPMEISAKKPAPFLRQVVPVKKPTFRDPRFDDLSGEYKPEIFESTYKFINDIKLKEKEVIKKQLKKTKTSNQRKEKLQFLLKRMENQERARLSREQQRERELQFKRQQRERANQGAQPFFLKSSEKKKLQLAEKYQELKKSGKLENFLSKKRKRNAGKDRRKLPRQLQMKKAA